MTRQYTVTRVGSTRDRLGEGPLWDVQEQALYWLDSRGPTVHRLDPKTGKREDWQVPSTVGSMALREKGGAVLAMEDGFHFLDFATGKTKPIIDPEPDKPGNRLNDGKVDKQGRFLAGSMATKISGQPEGTLYRLNHDLSLETMMGDIIVTNGPSFSPDGKTFYFSDSRKARIAAYDYGDAGVSNERILVDTKATYDAWPDGGTVDAEGYIWSAFVTAGKVARLSPAGKLDLLIDMPCSRPTSVMFGGPDLEDIYITSLSESHNMKVEGPDDGGLFVIEGLGIKGVAEPRFKG
jgi:L-arabinonolactonase